MSAVRGGGVEPGHGDDDLLLVVAAPLLPWAPLGQARPADGMQGDDRGAVVEAGLADLGHHVTLAGGRSRAASSLREALGWSPTWRTMTVRPTYPDRGSGRAGATGGGALGAADLQPAPAVNTTTRPARASLSRR